MTADQQRGQTNSIGAMVSTMHSAWQDPIARMPNMDLIAVLVAVLLRWSTCGVAIGMVLDLVALVTTVDLRLFLRLLRRLICELPIAFFALAVLGTLRSDAPWTRQSLP